MEPNIEPIGKSLTLGEGPYWDEETHTLFYVDIINHSLHSYKQDTNQHHYVTVDSGGLPVSLVVKVKGSDNKFVISVKNSLAFVYWDGVSATPLTPEKIVDLEDNVGSTRINDGKCDPSHRLWAGTMGAQSGNEFEPEKGSLYLLQQDKSVKKYLSKISISNGLAWSLDKKKFYYIDTLKYKVNSYDYDDATGSISNESTAFCFKENNIEGFPDGMTIDQEGMLWVACYLGAKVLRIDPISGKVKLELKIPSLQVTSVIFGGPELEDLYVTSAKHNLTQEMENKYPLAGYTFRVTGLGVKGTPSLPIKL